MDPSSGADFGDLLDAVASVPGLRRLRFVTSYPRDFTPKMVASVGRHETICPYLHLPVQSGSDHLLRRMGRGYTVAQYLDLVAQLRATKPGINLSTDLILGFPGETDADFQASLELLETVRFGALFAFCYSERPGTAAPKLDGKVDRELAEQRLRDLLAVQVSIQRELNQHMLGRELEVLITGPSKDGGKIMGRTPCHRIAHFEPSSVLRVGSLVPARIEATYSHSLLAIPLLQAEPSSAERRRLGLPVLA